MDKRSLWVPAEENLSDPYMIVKITFLIYRSFDIIYLAKIDASNWFFTRVEPFLSNVLTNMHLYFDFGQLQEMFP